jgi:GNAT superfamily N-acetyltransferase
VVDEPSGAAVTEQRDKGVDVESVRLATDGDAERLSELAGQMTAAAATQRGASEVVAPEWEAPIDEHLRRWLSEGSATHRAWVGSFEGLVCGFALAHLDEGDERPRRGVLDACFVEPAARGVGLGRLLLDACLAWMAARGCAGVDGAAFPGDRTAKNFYEGAGFKARLLTMHRPLVVGEGSSAAP